MSEQTPVIYHVENQVAWLRLNRPEHLNAMTNSLMRGICEAVQRVRDDSQVRVLVLTGEGRGFCAGADLKQVADGNAAASAADNISDSADEDISGDYFNQALAAIKNSPVPTVARVNGPAAGGGLGLALACDVTIAAESAFFVATFGPNLGIVPDMGTTWNLPRRVGRARALGMTLLGQRIDANQAEDWGLIWRAVADEALDDATQEVISILRNSSPDASKRIRETIDAGVDNGFERQLELEMEHQAVLIPKNMREGAKAFLEKRQPQFSGSRKQ